MAGRLLVGQGGFLGEGHLLAGGCLEGPPGKVVAVPGSEGLVLHGVGVVLVT